MTDKAAPGTYRVELLIDLLRTCPKRAYDLDRHLARGSGLMRPPATANAEEVKVAFSVSGVGVVSTTAYYAAGRRALCFSATIDPRHALDAFVGMDFHIWAAAAKRGLWETYRQPVDWVLFFASQRWPGLDGQECTSTATFIVGERVLADGEVLLERALGALVAARSAGWPAWEDLGEQELDRPPGEGPLS